MITVCMGKSAPLQETRMWFDRAVTIRADYIRAYDSFIEYLQPRWCGSESHLAAFGKSCLDTGRFDTNIPDQIFKTHIFRSKDYRNPLEYWRSLPADEVSVLEAYFAERESQPIHEAYQRIDRSVAAVVWFVCGREKEMMRNLQLLNFSVDPHAFHSMPVKMSDLQRVIQASGAQASAKIGESGERDI